MTSDCEPHQVEPFVADEEYLWRRLLPSWITSESVGTPRISSIAFIDRRSGEVSVHRAQYSTKEAALRNHPEHSLAEIVTKIPRSLGHDVVADPTIEDPSHALIRPPEGASHGRRKKDAKRMAEASRLV